MADEPMSSGLAALLPDGRLHLQDGPIDLVIGLEGTRAGIAEAAARATRAFEGLLARLVTELPVLRQPIGVDRPDLRGPVARRMADAVWPFRAGFITPMAAVAGAVAEEVLAALAGTRGLTAAHVNNGGDIAVFLAAGQVLRVGVVQHLARAMPEALIRLRAGDGVQGIATSGWPGRSFSRGIADAVTVLAASASRADAAATVIANAVDAPHQSIRRMPAHLLDPDSDLGGIPVTVAVGPLPEAVAAAALDAGEARAEALLSAGLILGAALVLGGAVRVVGAEGQLPIPRDTAP